MSQDDDQHTVHLTKAEKAIQRILLDLEEHTGRKIEHMQLDTRRFANLRVEIFFEELA